MAVSRLELSSLNPPSVFVLPTENPFIPPRTDKGETEGRQAYIPQRNNEQAYSSDEERKSRSVTRKLARKDKQPKENDREKRTKKKAHLSGKLGISSGSKFRARRNSDAKRITQKVVDSRLIKSTQNLDLSSLSESIHTQIEFEERLKNQEIIVQDLKAKLDTYGDTECSAKAALREKLMEQVTLLTEIRMHVNIMKDFHVKGYLEMRITDPTESTSEIPFLRFWFYLNYPRLCCYENEGDETPSGAIPLSSEIQVIPSPGNKRAFSIIPAGGFSCYEFVADKPNVATKWQRAICKAANVQLGNIESVENALKLNDSMKDKSVFRRVRSVLRIGSSGSGKECRCYNLDEFLTWTDSSSLLETDSREDSGMTAHTLTAGTLKDFFFWILFHFPVWEASHDNPDLIGFFLHCPQYGESFDIVQAIFEVWRYFEENGFPPEIGAAGMKKRFYYVVKQWMHADICFIDMTSEIEARRSLKEYVKRTVDTTQAESMEKIDPIAVLNVSQTHEYSRCEGYIPISKTSLIQVDREEIAQQLTVKESKLFMLITQREIMNYIWETPNSNLSAVENLLRHNDVISRWVITTLLQSDSVKEQATFYKKFYRIAKRLYEMRNYNGCASILEGLLDVSIQSLRELREFLSTRYLNKTRKLAIIFSPLNEFARFSCISYSEMPCVPYLRYGIHQLRVLEELPTFKNKKKGQINFSKMAEVREVFLKCGFGKPKLCDYSSSLFIDPSIQELINNLSPLEYEKLNQISISREPTRMAQAVLEMEILERDMEIQQLRQQLKKIENDRNRIVEELGLDKESLNPTEAIAFLTPNQLKDILSLLAHERSVARKKPRRDSISATK